MRTSNQPATILHHPTTPVNVPTSGGLAAIELFSTCCNLQSWAHAICLIVVAAHADETQPSVNQD